MLCQVSGLLVSCQFDCGNKTDHGYRSNMFRADDSYHIDADMCSLGFDMFRFSLKCFIIVML